MKVYNATEFSVLEDPENVFVSSGDLHDARIERFDWIPEQRELTLLIDDLNSNFHGLPDYKGLAPAMLQLRGVESVNFNFAVCESHLNIDEFIITKAALGIAVSVKFWPGGQCDIQCTSIGIKELKKGQE